MWRLLVACVVNTLVASASFAGWPFGSIHVGEWRGGVYTNDNTGKFTFCAATTNYASGITMTIARDATDAWLFLLTNPDFQFAKGDTVVVDVLLDGQRQSRLIGTATLAGPALVATMPLSVANDFRKASFMVAAVKGKTFQFNLSATEALMSVLASCAIKVKANGVDKAADFSEAKAAGAKGPGKQADASSASSPTPPAPPKPAKMGTQTGTGFVISTGGHVVTNNHVVNGCVGDILGNLNGEASVKLRKVSGDSTNDLALLQAPEGTFKTAAVIRDRPVHSGDSVVAIGYPFHGLLTSDFTVTTGIVNSLSGLLNNTRYLQISAAVQPGNSGGPLLDTGGEIVGMVAAKLDFLKFVRATRNVPENINFAIKTGAIRDFLDNSVVPYQTAEPKAELKTADIAQAARAYTLLISCNATEQAETAKR